MGIFSVAAFAAEPDARFIFSRESNRTEHGSALVANLVRENTVLLEECVALPDSELHGYASTACGSLCVCIGSGISKPKRS